MALIKLTRSFEQGIASRASTEIPFRVLGYATGIGASLVDVSPVGGVYVFPPAGGIQMQIVSDSANDVVTTGTGARVVTIVYLDQLYVEHTITVNMNGKTPVATTPTNIFRINRFYTSASGSIQAPDGNITLQNIAGTINYSKILVGFNNSCQAIFTIPLANTGYLTAWQIGSGQPTSLSNYATARLMATTNRLDELISLFDIKDITIVQSNQQMFTYPIPFKFPEKTDIKVSVIASGGTTFIASTGLHGWYEPQ